MTWENREKIEMSFKIFKGLYAQSSLSRSYCWSCSTKMSDSGQKRTWVWEAGREGLAVAKEDLGSPRGSCGQRTPGGLSPGELGW